VSWRGAVVTPIQAAELAWSHGGALEIGDGGLRVTVPWCVRRWGGGMNFGERRDGIGWLAGWRTYIVAASLVLTAAASFALGDATLGEAIRQALEGLGLAALRLGIAGQR
jgi:hypothetical protein